MQSRPSSKWVDFKPKSYIHFRLYLANFKTKSNQNYLLLYLHHNLKCPSEQWSKIVMVAYQ